MSKARKFLLLEGDFPMHRSGVLQSPTIAYETWGELNGRADNAILIFTGLSPSAHAASSVEDPSPGWWEEMIGPGRPIDTRRYFVICVNSLGSCFGSTGPASIDPATGQPYRLTFPVLSLEDVASACGRRTVDGRDDGAGVRNTVSRAVAWPGDHFLWSAFAALCDGPALTSA
jgi:homoserine O-acetyltransferase